MRSDAIKATAARTAVHSIIFTRSIGRIALLLRGAPKTQTLRNKDGCSGSLIHEHESRATGRVPEPCDLLVMIFDFALEAIEAPHLRG